MRKLVWFRSDLRIQDHTALSQAALAATDGVVGVFTVCREQWQRHDWGTSKVDFVLRNVIELRDALSRLGIPMLIVQHNTFASSASVLLDMARRLGCDALYFNIEHEVNEMQRDAEVRSQFESDGMAVHAFVDQTVLDVSTIRTTSGTYYTKFTPFKRKWLKCLVHSEHLKPRPAPKRQQTIVVSEVPCTDPVPTSDPFRGDLWPAGEKEGLRRLRDFLSSRVQHYDRNRDLPAQAGTSTLSPYLSLGVISARQCLRDAIGANEGRVDGGSSSISKWIDELIWREFYRHVLIGFPRVCRHRPFREETRGLRWRHDKARFQSWCAGRTGVPIVDAGMRQLTQTGWMHNRVRMITAMYLSKNLFIDWRWGERFFMQHLVDADFANNNGGWQWSASTGTDAVPYFRMFNPVSQGHRFDPNGDYVRRFVPELAELAAPAIHDPAASDRKSCGYPNPLVDQAESRRTVLQAFQSLK